MKARKSTSQTSSTREPSANAAAGEQATMTSPVLGHPRTVHVVNDMSPSFVGHESTNTAENAAHSILEEHPSELLTTNEEISSFEFLTPVSGLNLQNMATNNDPQCDVDMDIPNQSFDDFWYWLGDFGNEMQGVYGSFESRSDGLHQPRATDSNEDFGGQAVLEPREGSIVITDPSESSDESPDAPSPWPLSWTPRQMDAGLPATEATGVDHSILEIENFAHVGRLSFEKYEEIVENLEIHANQPIYQTFGSPVLPSAEVMNSFIQLYFEHFHDTMPFIHKSSFDPSKEHWILVLAIAATGCRFSQVPRSDLYGLKLTELVRRSIMVVVSQSV